MTITKILTYITFYFRFQINSNTGEITTFQPLDYETASVHIFLVMARDAAVDTRTGTTTVTVQVQDTEDSTPIFVQSVYETDVPENTGTSQPIVTVSVCNTYRILAHQPIVTVCM